MSKATFKIIVFAILCFVFLSFSNNVLSTNLVLRQTGLNIQETEKATPTLEAIEPITESELPSFWDWREHGGVTPVKDQGATGTCWAFATVGPLEHAIKIQDNEYVSLSEQFLVSFNKEGWGGNGGWFAHDYHIDPGAVLEVDFPYMARDNVPWKIKNYDHKYKLTDWGYVDEFKVIPSEDAIKTAILKYGSVGAAVHADYSFQAYKKGVFRGSWFAGQVNHAIMLTGWNDALGAWILKNSWGTGWGDNGYMYIKYGANSVGYAANYVVYK